MDNGYFHIFHISTILHFTFYIFLRGLFASEAAGLHHHAADARRAGAHGFYRQVVGVFRTLSERDAKAFLYGLAIHLAAVAWHFYVIAGRELAPEGNSRPPVRHRHTVESPFIAQYAGDESVVLAAVATVHAVVGRHYRPRLRFLDGALEPAQVDLAERPLSDDILLVFTRRLAVIAGEVLERRANAAPLTTVASSSSCAKAKEVTAIIAATVRIFRVFIG